MSIKLELDAASIKKAITTHISNQGFDLAGKTVEVSLVNGRGGNGNRAVIVISDEVTVVTKTSIPEIENDVIDIAANITEAPITEATEIVEDVSSNTDQSMYLEQDMAVADDIMAAAEGASNPFAEEDISSDDDDSLFPSISPGDIEQPKSLF
jgi:hypothetical protein